jgi:cell division protease FtsH
VSELLRSARARLGRRLERGLLRVRRARAARRRGGRNKVAYLLVVTLVALLAAFWAALAYLRPSPRGVHISIGRLSALASDGRLTSATFYDEDSIVAGSFAPVSESRPQGSPEAERAGIAAVPSGGGRYWSAYPSDGAVTAVLVQMTTKAGSDVDVEAQPSKKAVRTAATFLLPLVILANLFALLFTAGKGSSSGIGDIVSFSSIGTRRHKRKKGPAPVSFASVAGADEAVAELKEVVDYLTDPRRYAEIGATPPKGVLLFGPPGCGKTLLAKAVAGEAGVPFFSVAGAEFVESLVGVGAARVRDLFQRVRAVAPAIVFIDELDAAGRKRGQGGGGGGSDEREQTLNQILVEMDGFEVTAGIVLIGATNRPDILDPALLRPGRFDRHVTIDQPDAVGRELILELHAANKPMSPEVDLSRIARRTPGFSGADLANVLNEAALLTIREGKSAIETAEVEEAIQRVLAGPKKKGRVLEPEERQRAAYHESGHALVAAASGRLEDVHRVTILARGRGLGMTSIQRESDAALLTKDQLLAQLTTALAGIAAEELVFGMPSTGAEQDLADATELARDMVGRFGMGTRRRRLLANEGESFLGDDLILGQISAQTHHEMEVEIDELLAGAEGDAMKLLEQHREVLDMLATRLEAEETLEGSDLDSIVALVRPEVALFGGLVEGISANGRAEAELSQDLA